MGNQGENGNNLGVRPRVYVDPHAGDHETGRGHPERAARVEACLTALADSGIEVEVRTAPEASSEDLERVHPTRYLDRLARLCERGGGALDPDTWAGPLSLRVARRASGACCEAVEAAWAGVRSFCLVRPPGHHATPIEAMGFCLLNHAAVGAARALASGAAGNVLVLDIDVHHGNGTQDVFWSDPRVLYLSIHQWPWYPWRSGALEEIGEGQGVGTNLNIPLPAGSDDGVYLQAIDRIVSPAARTFRPDLIIVSAGFDAHVRDPLSLMQVSSEGFGRIAHRVVGLAEEVCSGRLVMTLEGGYDLEGLSESFVATVGVLAGAPEADEVPPPPALFDVAPQQELERAVAFHARRWGAA